MGIIVSSGQQILGRDDMNNEAQDLTAQILKKAQERSAHDFDAPQNKGKFSGAGHRLGETISNVPQEQQLSSSEGEEKTVTITFYQDGFTIDDGELRRYDDPVNREFLKAINEGYVPREVAGKAKEVLVNLVDKKSEKYIPPKKAFQAFKGEGRTLSGAVRSVPSTSTPEPVHTPTYSADLNRPHTTIQIRLHDGTRLSGTFNLDDTVKRLIQFVQAARPNVGNFQLMTTFPRKVLNDPHQTIEQAGLKNATVIQNLV
jgi:UBX domain-containing protein 1